MKETKIVKVINEQGGKTYITEAGSYIKRTRSSFSVYDSNPQGPHKSIHFDILPDGSLRINEKGIGEVIVPAYVFK